MRNLISSKSRSGKSYGFISPAMAERRQRVAAAKKDRLATKAAEATKKEETEL